MTEDDSEKIIYLKALMKESLSLHRSLPLLLPRYCILGYDIALGTRVINNSWAIGRKPLLWENPDYFRPDKIINTGMDFRG